MVSNNQFVRSLKRNALAAALGMCFIGASIAAETGGLRITITGNDGLPVAGATVRVSSPDSLVAKSAVTEADGSVRLSGLDPATNYTVEVVASGYDNYSAGNVAVVSGKNLSVGYALGATTLDTVIVTGASLAAVDTTSATVGTTLNLDIVESLPTGRSYQSYLQLVPGVKPSADNNPSSKSGVNYSDVGGDIGSSTDNVYYLDGVNVTDPLTGTFGANFNSEIIQEQQVLTGGIPAEYAGGAGLVSKVITKSGSDEFHGSINYYLQNDSLVADDKHGESAGFSTFDTAVTLGGPIVKDKLWFFGSYQIKNREDEVVDPVTGEALRTVNTDQDLAFFKTTWQLTDDDRLTATFFNDPYERDGSTDATVINNRDTAREQGGDNYKIEYTHDWANLRLNTYGYRHEAQLSTLGANPDTRNDVAYFGGDPTNADLQQGGFGTNTETWRNRDEFGLSLEYWLDTTWGSHTFKMGYTQSDNDYTEDARYTGADSALYRSIAAEDAGATFDEFTGAGWTGTRSIVAGDTARIITAMNASEDSAYYLGLLDADSDGSISAEELGAYQFTSTDGNPTGQVNNYRIQQSGPAPYTVTTKGKTFYLQDTWTLNQWTINAGVRAEEWGHFDSFGQEVFTFDWELAPRLSVVYDLMGDGRSKVWGFVGRYYDPIRNDMTDFAGAGAGPVYNEQIFLGDRWLTFRSRGPGDAIFAPTTETPYTDELVLGYATTFGQDMNLSVIYTKRETKDIFEDYDLGLYSNPSGDTANGQADQNSDFYLPYSYFGYDSAPPFNYVIGTLAGGERKYQGLEVTLQKYKRNNWQGMLSYTYNDAEGNSNSDGNADFQGDWIALDPRAPNQWGPQPGNIEHQFKAFGTYFMDFGLELSGVFNWNSGAKYSRTYSLYGRHLPEMTGTPYEVGGVTDTWILPGAVGGETGPSYSTFDVRAKYTRELPVGQLEFFLDIFNVFDQQSATAEQDLIGGDGVYAFGEANDWVEPRRAYLGVRYSF
ncbi:carboxypeptidase regulatory-like domain-containing protein [Lysobacter sp. F60174L2]|uniref:carboxypeptidase regulatory-like domain-containing protein n=1 Tax=Lysobacter sp. F60174L2 TaxID=3459295 RepID=UPI00403E2384